MDIMEINGKFYKKNNGTLMEHFINIMEVNGTFHKYNGNLWNTS